MTEKDNDKLSRRQVMAGVGTAAVATGALVSSTGKAAEAVVGEECMTILYENIDGVNFDFDYYNNTHMPLIMDRYGSSISRFELRRGQPAADGTPPRYIATVTIWIADADAFAAAAAVHQAALQADVPKFTNAPLYAQRDTIVGLTSDW